MRILILSNYYPPFEKGGYEQLCHDVTVRFRERGHAVEVLTSDFGGNSDAELELGVHRTLKISPNYHSRSSVVYQFYFSRSYAERHNISCLRQTASSFEPDFIFIWNLQGIPRSLAVEAECLPYSTVVYWLAGYTPVEPDEYWNYWTSPGATILGRVMKRMLGQVALNKLRSEGKPIRPKMGHTAVVSKYMREKGIREETLPSSTQVIYNGVELEEFFHPVQSARHSLRMLQAGRVSSDKGVHISIEALNILINHYDFRDLTLTVAGGSNDFAYEDHLEAMVQQYDLATNIRFMGWVPRKQMPSIMHDHHILLLPTIHQEPFARVVLEAMAAGMTVVAADTGGTGEIIEHNETGLLCSANDAHELADQIRRLLEQPHLRIDLAQSGQKRVTDTYGLDTMVDKLEQFLIAAGKESVQS